MYTLKSQKIISVDFYLKIKRTNELPKNSVFLTYNFSFDVFYFCNNFSNVEKECVYKKKKKSIKCNYGRLVTILSF